MPRSRTKATQNSFYNVLSKYYYDKQWSLLKRKQKVDIEHNWYKICLDETVSSDGLSPQEFRKKYLLRMKLTPLWDSEGDYYG